MDLPDIKFNRYSFVIFKNAHLLIKNNGNCLELNNDCENCPVYLCSIQKSCLDIKWNLLVANKYILESKDNYTTFEQGMLAYVNSKIKEQDYLDRLNRAENFDTAIKYGKIQQKLNKYNSLFKDSTEFTPQFKIKYSKFNQSVKMKCYRQELKYLGFSFINLLDDYMFEDMYVKNTNGIEMGVITLIHSGTTQKGKPYIKFQLNNIQVWYFVFNIEFEFKLYDIIGTFCKHTEFGYNVRTIFGINEFSEFIGGNLFWQIRNEYTHLNILKIFKDNVSKFKKGKFVFNVWLGNLQKSKNFQYNGLKKFYKANLMIYPNKYINEFAYLLTSNKKKQFYECNDLNKII